MAATAAAIRDRVRTLIESISPASAGSVLFRSFRNEGAANFDEWASLNPSAALRRFQARDDGNEDPPEVSNTDSDMRHFTILVSVAYPATARYGADQALDRDDAIDEDWGTINGKIGIYGRANFSGAHDCTPLGCERNVSRGQVVDMLEVRARFSYYRTVT